MNGFDSASEAASCIRSRLRDYRWLLCLCGLVIGMSEARADSCPYCGQGYGDAAPGDEARVMALRSSHEASCAAAHSSSQGGGWVSPAVQLPTPQETAEDRAHEEAVALNRQANEAWKKGKLAEAVALYRKAVKTDPYGDRTIKENLRLCSANWANEQGNGMMDKQDYATAVTHYREALRLKPESDVIRQNLADAESMLAQRMAWDAKQAEQQRKDALASGQLRDQLKDLSRTLDGINSGPDFDGDGKAAEASSGKLEFMKLEDKTAARNPKPSPAQAATVDVDGSVVDLREARSMVVDPAKVAANEQIAISTQRESWLVNQRKLFADTSEQRVAWGDGLLKALETGQEAPADQRPKALADLLPGDVLLMLPDYDHPVSSRIPAGERKYRELLTLFEGDRASSDRPEKKDVAHTVLYLKTVNGNRLYLDHQAGEGSRVLDEKEFQRRYAKRLSYVARPQGDVSGQKLWEAARKAALHSTAADFGAFGKHAQVCAEKDMTVLAKASSLPLDQFEHRNAAVTGPIDVTPGDFFDQSVMGDYFLVSPLDSTK